ncbi:hypothetical protein JOQ06_000983 [Pogonophryne albipinna]|uniref:Rab effector MyRIP/Melanophilin domain-containing protein n=1 Tax=Pogonophryne albipinna TaxID=1090488 RepID=A0AAD6B4I9_9TELE|nr:hypothetical protein JOQ06_000983 [Pogonophryne albipinna]
MAETLTVALRVAEEAIDEAISKAEFDTASQEKQNEALYLREHRGQLVEELSKTIVQKIITSSSIEHQPGLWRSHSAFSLLDNNPAGRIQNTQTLKKEGGTLPTWKSVDRLDNAAVSSVLKSPDGNWIALQIAQLSRPGLLTKRKSPFFSTLEREAEVVSAYEGVSSDNETKADSSWGGVLQEIHRNMADSNFNLQDGIPFQLPGSRDELCSDSEGERKPRSLLALFKRKVPAEIRKPASSRRTSIIDSQEDSEEDDHYQQTYEAATPDTLTSGASTPESDDLESDITGSGANQTEQELTSQPQFSQSSSGEEEGEEAEDGGARDASDDEHREEERQESEDGYEEDEGLRRMEIDPEEGRTEEGNDEEMESRLYRLVAHSRRTYFSSTDDDLDKVGQMKVCRLVNQANATLFCSTEDELDRVGRGEEAEEAMAEETLWKMQQEHLDVQNTRLRDLASLVSASQFSSSEDELERVGETEEEANEEGIEREEIVGEPRESFEDLDVDMFDVMGENEERKTESSDEDVKDQTEVKEDCMQERVPAEDICDEKVEVLEEEAVKKAQGTERRQEMEFETVIQAEKTEEDAETDSDVDDAEFERIISSMLMMTLEDMQVGTLEDEATENRSENIETEDTDESATVGGFEDSAVDARSTKVSEETGKVSQSRGDVKGNEQIGGDISRKKESEDATDGNENEGEDTDVQEGHVNAAMEETPEVKQTCERIEVGDEEQDGRRGIVLEEGTTMETQEDREVKETDERREETKESVEDMEQSSTSPPHGLLSPEEIQNGSDLELYKTIQFISTLLEQRYSAVSLRSITTEVLKVLNATEELLLLQGGGGDGTPLPPHTDPKKLDQQFSRLEENVYVAAGEVFSLEAELGDLEEVARGVCSDTPGLELSFLEEQVASAAARVQQSELQISDISARIAALKSAGLNVDTQQARFTKTRTVPFMPVTVDSSRQQRRRLPAPPVKGRSVS